MKLTVGKVLYVSCNILKSIYGDVIELQIDLLRQ